MSRSLVRPVLTPHDLHLYNPFDIAEAENRPKSAHRYNVAEQQQIYKSEIERIWKAQFDSLSRKDEPILTPEEEAAAEEPQKPVDVRKRRQSAASALSPMPVTPGPASPAFSRGSSLAREREMSQGLDQRKVLRIRRMASVTFLLRLPSKSDRSTGQG